MSTPLRRKLAVMIFAGFGVCLAAAHRGVADDRVYLVNDPYCDVCPRQGWGASLKYKLRLHGLYLKRACTQRYVMLPQSVSPYLGPSPYCPYPGYTPYATPGYSGYGYGSSAPPARVP